MWAVLTRSDYAGVLAELRRAMPPDRSRDAQAPGADGLSPHRRVRHDDLRRLVWRAAAATQEAGPSRRFSRRPSVEGPGPALRREPAPKAALYAGRGRACPSHSSTARSFPTTISSTPPGPGTRSPISRRPPPSCSSTYPGRHRPGDHRAGLRQGLGLRPAVRLRRRARLQPPRHAPSPKLLSKRFVEVLVAPATTRRRSRSYARSPTSASSCARARRPGAQLSLDRRRGPRHRARPRHRRPRLEGRHQARADRRRGAALRFAWAAAST